MKNILLSVLVFSGITNIWAAGSHSGEAGKIETSVSFLDSSGYTTTDARGTHYNFYGMTFDEPKVYPSWTYGKNYPLYFIGNTMNFTVTMRNAASKGAKPFKIKVKALNNVLETDGSPGMSLAAPQEWIVEDLRPGESRVLSGSVYIAPDPNLPSGLDITKIRISHLNEGGNEDAGLIKEEIAVWCPPKYKP
ncbi:MAG: hypothetical protein HY747_03075 [Elusimicrobia bacterium]|nr:hypothetical protein [Elusimicrobiota bacterium]